MTGIETTPALQVEVWKHPLIEIARAQQITPYVLALRIRREGVSLPPREYWEKIERGLSRQQALREIGWTPQMVRKVDEILQRAKAQAKRK